MKRIFYLIGLLYFSLTVCSFADELSEGYSCFKENNIPGAITHFQAAINISDTRSEASLMLSLISCDYIGQDSAFRYFHDFCNSTENPQPYIQALFHIKCGIGYDNDKSSAQVSWMKELLKIPGLNTTLKAYLQESLSNYYHYKLDLIASREYSREIGTVDNWQLVGDFENISGSGFDKNYAPILHAEPEAVFKNKIGADVKWFNLFKKVPGLWIDLTNNFNCTNTMVFAQTFCNVANNQQVYLRIGTSGSLKVWVNDQLMFSEEEERNNGIDTYIIPVSLFQGNNRILLQLGSSKIKRCNFMMRVTDKTGNNLTDLKFSEKFEPYLKTIQPLPVAEELYSERFFRERIQKNPENLANYLVLILAYLGNDKRDSAMAYIRKIQKKAPDCGFIWKQQLVVYDRADNKTMSSLIREKLKKIDQNDPEVIEYQIDEAFEGQKFDQVREWIKKLELFKKFYDDVLFYKLKLANNENNGAEYANLIKSTYAQYPLNYSFMMDYFKYNRDYKKDEKAAIMVLKNYTKRAFSSEALEVLSDEYIESGKVQEGYNLLKKLIDIYPFSDGYYDKLGKYYSQYGNYELAKPMLEACLAIAPYYGPYHGNYAKFFEETGNIQRAIEEYKMDVFYSPDDYSAIEKISQLQSKKSVSDYFPARDYDSIYVHSPAAKEFPDDNILALTEDNQVTLFENGGCEKRYISFFKVLTLKGIDYLKEFNLKIPDNEDLTIEKAQTFKSAGNHVDAEVKDNQVVFTSLEPGDAILLIYKTTKTVRSEMSKQFYNLRLFGNWYPYLDLEYHLLVDKHIAFDYKMNHTPVKPDIQETDNFKLYTWKRTNGKAINLESYMPSITDASDLLSISTIKDWNFISKWYFDISNTKSKPDHEIIDKVHDILDGKENLNQMQKARLFYNFIEKSIRYSSVSFRQSGIVPQKASTVLETRIGDCKDLAVLFTSMCRVVGIQCEVVLVMNRRNGVDCAMLPSFDFDHAIAKAILDGRDYYIELTSSNYPFGALSTSHLRSPILEVRNDTGKLARIQPLLPSNRVYNNLIAEERVSFEDDSMISTIRSFRSGVLAAEVRNAYRNLGKEEREKTFTKALTINYPNIRLETLEFNKALDDCSDTVSYNYTYVASDVFSKFNNLFIVKLPIALKYSPMAFLSIKDRKFPVELWKIENYDTLSENIIIQIPKGKKLAEMPKSVHYSCKQGDYSLSFTLEGNALHLKRQVAILEDQVPVSEYSQYRTFMQLVVNSDNMQIGFTDKMSTD